MQDLACESLTEGIAITIVDLPTAALRTTRQIVLFVAADWNVAIPQLALTPSGERQ